MQGASLRSSDRTAGAGGSCCPPDAAICGREAPHDHDLYGESELRSRQIRTRRVAALTLATMTAEIVVGVVSGSLALTADGWHMGAHAGAFALAALAYWYARRSFGRAPSSAARVCAGAGVANAVALAMIAVFMLAEAATRLLEPTHVRYAQALPVAALGLVVNVISLRMLHVEEHEHHDHNLRGAHLHVLSDLMTSVLALVALMAGRLTGLGWPDPACAIVGAIVILVWGARLGRDSARVLWGPAR
jgi:cation diffusion facilitator family transporter